MRRNLAGSGKGSIKMNGMGGRVNLYANLPYFTVVKGTSNQNLNM